MGESIDFSMYAPEDLSEIYGLTGDEWICKICGQMFATCGALSLHKANKHFKPHLTEDLQWDFGQLDLANGVSSLWNELMHEHDLPRVVFLYGTRYLSGKYKSEDAFLPRFYERKVLDEITGQYESAICFPDAWLKLDPDAKCTSIVHLAAHVENLRSGMYDTSFNKMNHHGLKFKNVALTYDVKVLFHDVRGWSICVLTDTFRSKHAYSMMLISRHHPLKVVKGSTKCIRCIADI